MSAWSNWAGKFCFIAALAVPIALSGASLPVLAQDQQGQPQPQQQPQQQPLTQQQVQQLVAPIALYSDALLAQVLTASTYPLEVVMAARWSEKNPDLKGAALEDGMQKEPWDPSVKGLTSVPQVLAMMSDKLDWTQQLGEAFLAQPDDTQNAIQVLRARADEAGNLKSNKEQNVRRVAATPSPGYAGPPEYIVIEPVEPDYVYVPVYDPVVVYGADYWPPAYAPFFWYPRWWTVGPVIGFGAAAFVGPALWYHYNWGNRGYAAVQTNTALYSRFNRVNVTGGGQFQNWRFDAAHRANVPFKNTNLQRQFGSVGAKGVQGMQSGKGAEGTKTSKAVEGIQSGKKSMHGVQTGSGVQEGRRGKNVEGIKTSKAVQGIQTDKNIQNVHTGNRVQGGQQTKRIQGIQMGNVQKMQASKKFQGSKKNMGQGQGQGRP